ncbi:MAG: peptidylprolyl isomerase, partial [Thermoguttaceae bacterium]|nr:peptidylprolyl isomerase [Thermoguttaceae bacterium]
DPNSAGSQFYISFLPTQFLDGQYTVFGRVVEGLDTLSKIERVDPERMFPGQKKTQIIEMRVLRKRNHDYSNFRRM